MKTFAYIPEELEKKSTGGSKKSAKPVAKASVPPPPPAPPREWSAPSITLTVLVVVFLASVGVRFFQQENPFGWLFGPNGGGGGGIPENIGTALAPILALSLAIERLIETIFDFFETNVKQVAKNTTGMAASLTYINEVRTLYSRQLSEAKDALQEAIEGRKSKKEQEAAVSAVKRAEELVLEAGSKLENLTKDPMYTSWKRALSIWLGLVMGMVVAVFTDKGIFYYLNFNVPRIVEMLLTGFILGAGSGPLHSLIGILQGAKDALGNFGAANGVGLGRLNQQVRSLTDQINKKA